MRHPPIAHPGPTAFLGSDRKGIEGLTAMMTEEGKEGGKVWGADAK